MSQSTTLPTAPLPGALRIGASRGVLEVREFFREWETVVFTFSLPTLILVLFSSIFEGITETPSGMSVTEFYLPGLVAMGLMSVSFQNLGIGIANERSNGTLRRLRGTPMPPAAYFVGKSVLVLALAAGQVTLLLAVAGLVYGADLHLGVEGWLTFAWVLVLGTVPCAFLGIAISSAARSVQAASGIVVVPFLVLQFLSGIFLPAAILPEGALTAASLFPLKWMAQGMRAAFYPEAAAVMEPSGGFDLHLVAGALGAWCVVGLVLCLLTFRWKTAKDG
ncbi:ABC-2 type transport system permease protein [Lipingzhangella halophila]|uniref:Transport permease protein n=1 Tax=Lipingzhangella halophila TaxID=1783352 RepID=A0A7W7RJY8_9ACTN|nr:ABC transporter permease [Lipingzhangella halophila]MBB4933408.1 ABC-2 type transport system permease protein [Lipingzhangella halophila]